MKQLTAIALHPLVSKENFTVICAAIHEDVWSDWLDAGEARYAHNDKVAVVLDKLYARSIAEDVEPTPQMEETLQAMRTVPGACRFVYALNADSSDTNIEDAIFALISDEAIDEIALTVLVHRRREIVEELMTLRGQSLPPARLQSITEILATDKDIRQ